MESCGFLLVNKPKGMTSFFLVRSFRKLLNMRRIGYAGTLDPLASGLMIMAVGEATKLLHFLEQTEKKYEVEIRFGSVSETYDAEGPFHEVATAKPVLRDQIVQVLERDFLGERQQVPPKYSAVKIQGKHAYDLVRGGKDVQLKARTVTFYDVDVDAFEYPLLRCTVHCSAGTYIRSFAHDLGQILGCGAYVSDLKRVDVGEYSLQNAVDFSSLTPETIHGFLVPPEKFLSHWPGCELTDEEYAFLQHGGFVKNRWNVSEPQILALFQGHTVGLLETCEGGGMIKFAKKFNFD